MYGRDEVIERTYMVKNDVYGVKISFIEVSMSVAVMTTLITAVLYLSDISLFMTTGK